MDCTVLRKRLNTYKSSEGRLQNMSDEVIMDVLRAWENWPGSTADLYRDLGLTKMQMVSIIKKAKKLVKSGVVSESEFHEVKIAPAAEVAGLAAPCSYAIEMTWDGNKVLKFSKVEQLVDFLKKVA